MPPLQKKTLERLLIGLGCLAVFAPLLWMAYLEGERLKKNRSERPQPRIPELQELEELFQITIEQERKRMHELEEAEKEAMEKFPVVKEIKRRNGTLQFDLLSPGRPG